MSNLSRSVGLGRLAPSCRLTREAVSFGPLASSISFPIEIPRSFNSAGTVLPRPFGLS